MKVSDGIGTASLGAGTVAYSYSISEGVRARGILPVILLPDRLDRQSLHGSGHEANSLQLLH